MEKNIRIKADAKVGIDARLGVHIDPSTGQYQVYLHGDDIVDVETKNANILSLFKEQFFSIEPYTEWEAPADWNTKWMRELSMFLNKQADIIDELKKNDKKNKAA